jgi:integrase
MAIEKRTGKDGKPQYRVRINVNDTVTGARKWQGVGTYRTKKEAEAAERKALDQRERGTLLDPASTTVAELLTSWLATKAGEVTPQTVAGYEIAVRVHLIPALGSVKVQKLTAARVQAQYDAWRDEGMGARTLRVCHLRLSQALDQAVRFHLVQTNVCKMVTPARVPRPKPEVWNAGEAMTFLATAEGDSLAPLWHLLLLEGMRRGEALGLRWQDINWERGTAHIVQSVRAGIHKGEAIIQERTKTNAGARTVRLTGRTVAALKEHRKAQLQKRMAASQWEDHDLIICTSKGTPLNPTNVRKHFDPLVTRAGLRRITPHGLRHTHATMLLRQGVHPKIVSERLGHASIGLTLDVYSHLLPDSQTVAADAIDTIMKAAGNGA